MSLGGAFLPPVVLEVWANIDKLKLGLEKAKVEMGKLEAEGAAFGKKFGAGFKIGIAAAGVALAGISTILVKEAMEQQAALELTGKNIKKFGGNIEEVLPKVEAMSKHMVNLGFADEDAMKAFTKLNTAIGNSNTSLSMMSLTADLARKRQTSMEEAARLLARSITGNGRVFTEFGIKMDTSIKDPVERANKALFELQQKIGGAADSFAGTTKGKMEVFKAKVNELAETLGTALLPAVDALLTGLNGLVTWIQNNADVFSKVLVGAITLVTVALGAMAVAWVVANAGTIGMVLGIAALIATLAAAWDNIEVFRKLVITAFRMIGEAGTASLYVIAEGIALLLQGLDKLAGGLAAAAKALGQDDMAKTLDSWGEAANDAAQKMYGFRDSMGNAWKDLATTDNLEKAIGGFRFGDILGGVKNKVEEWKSTFTGLGNINVGVDSGGGGKGQTWLDKLIEQMNLFGNQFDYQKERVKGNIKAMQELAQTAMKKSSKWLADAQAYEKATRNTKKHEDAVKRLTAALNLATKAQAYQNDVAEQAAKNAEQAARSIDSMTNSYARQNSYLASLSRVSGFAQRDTYVEVPVVIDGQVLFRVSQKHSLVNNRRNTTNGLARSGSVI